MVRNTFFRVVTKKASKASTTRTTVMKIVSIANLGCVVCSSLFVGVFLVSIFGGMNFLRHSTPLPDASFQMQPRIATPPEVKGDGVSMGFSQPLPPPVPPPHFHPASSPSQPRVIVYFGYSKVTACIGDIVEVIWQGYHNIQEVENGSCASNDISDQILGYQSSGSQHIFQNNELGAVQGSTRYFKCQLHCADERARFEVSCPNSSLPVSLPPFLPKSAAPSSSPY